MIIRSADPKDADGIAQVLDALTQAGKRSRPSDRAFALSNYVAHPNKIACHVAVADDGTVLGFQSFKLALDGNEYGAPPGWALIGTHIHPDAARCGIGQKLFAATRASAQAAEVPAIEAFIGATNLEGQAYYEAMGFRDYRKAEGAICKCFNLR
ncbi:GNAT family N-acetyltransferase [Gymnodinialimonas sp. 2305UL16-5]|uniref:GNAT family N-acetyltransferase n=1 Tax=Gymnodinialimonas mytili TaxID=3126503 RepID=UPI0030A764A7